MRLTAVFLALAVVSAVACKKPEPPPPPAPPPASPTVRVQVISVDPPRPEANQAFRAQVFGSGFMTGVEVYIDSSRIAVVERLDSNTLEIGVPPLAVGPHDLQVKNPDGTAHTLRAAIVAKPDAPAPPPTDATAGLNCENITVSFDFDSSTLTSSATGTLLEHLRCFTARGGTVRIEGHCDERGTTEYNLALGQRRADAVKRWLATQGVPANRVQTVSYGEERPLDSRNTEAAWARNRRTEIRSGR